MWPIRTLISRLHTIQCGNTKKNTLIQISISNVYFIIVITPLTVHIPLIHCFHRCKLFLSKWPRMLMTTGRKWFTTFVEEKKCIWKCDLFIYIYGDITLSTISYIITQIVIPIYLHFFPCYYDTYTLSATLNFIVSFNSTICTIIMKPLLATAFFIRNRIS